MTDLLRILAAPLVWLASFSALYGLHGLICGHGLADAEISGLSLARLLLVAAWLLAIGMQIALLLGLYSRRFAAKNSLVRFISRATGWTGLIAVLWTLSPVALIRYCV